MSPRYASEQEIQQALRDTETDPMKQIQNAYVYEGIGIEEFERRIEAHLMGVAFQAVVTLKR